MLFRSFNLELAKHLPELAWENVEVKKLKSYKSDSTDYQLKISFRNAGKLPTALKQAHLVKIVAEDRVRLDFDTTGFGKDKIVFKVIPDEKPVVARTGRGRGFDSERPLQATYASRNVPFTEGGAVTDAVFKIRVFRPVELKGKASVFSTRGGVLKGIEFIIK